MPRYANGKAALSDLVYLGPDFYLPAGTAARWAELRRLGVEKYGVLLVVTPGWNGYRPLSIQYKYREELGIWAAVPGYSSHGLTYQGRDCAAVDVYNWRSLAPSNESLAWARFVALCRAVGFTVDFVSPREEWHIGDFDPFSVPAFASIVINPETTAKPDPLEDEDMATIISSSIGQSLAIAGLVVPYGHPDEVRGTKSTAGLPVSIVEVPAAVHTRILDADARRRAADPAEVLPIVVYAKGGDGTVYIFDDGEVRYLTDPDVLNDLIARGAMSVTWPQHEIDSLRKQQGE
ncbi:hypothetical protein DEU35_1449 [Microbacterium sp. AG157]|uniref:hypothetical protein n=1 Tax=Microbacterium sp. AG157 TaxID=2183993 RepID=UPI000E24CE19|nr:hypothetical protein [Microbacterium sp. AG157]REC98349.1 hypothetical protein DEU35_1449 [Microbacterium sp. AG157]